MSVGLIAIIAIVVVSIGVYLFVLSRHHTKSTQASDMTFSDDDYRTERAISESPVYKQTKEQMKRLRADLDRFGETLDSVSEEIRNGSERDLDDIYKRGIPRMHDALIDVRNAAEDLLATVDGRPRGEVIQVGIVGETHRAPRRSPAGPLAATRADQLYEELLDTGARVSPYIAGFYFALTVADEDSQETDATVQAKLVIEQLDEAISVMTELEKELAGT
ncbi:MAG: hypothetical protein GY854_05725 [Deltaproteobacteria bacterium]|nr:hypothetical protein [Deltaproteobacteria bacterium]